MRQDGTNIDKHRRDLAHAGSRTLTWRLTGPSTISPCCVWRAPSSTKDQTMGSLRGNLNVEHLYLD